MFWGPSESARCTPVSSSNGCVSASHKSGVALVAGRNVWLTSLPFKHHSALLVQGSNLPTQELAAPHPLSADVRGVPQVIRSGASAATLANLADRQRSTHGGIHVRAGADPVKDLARPAAGAAGPRRRTASPGPLRALARSAAAVSPSPLAAAKRARLRVGAPDRRERIHLSPFLSAAVSAERGGRPVGPALGRGRPVGYCRPAAGIAAGGIRPQSLWKR
jgi:hypothetical protein